MEAIYFTTAGAVLMGWLLPNFVLGFSTRNISYENSINILSAIGMGLITYGLSL